MAKELQKKKRSDRIVYDAIVAELSNAEVLSVQDILDIIYKHDPVGDKIVNRDATYLVNNKALFLRDDDVEPKKPRMMTPRNVSLVIENETYLRLKDEYDNICVPIRRFIDEGLINDEQKK